MLTFIYPLIVPRERKEGGGVFVFLYLILFIYRYINIYLGMYCGMYIVYPGSSTTIYLPFVIQRQQFSFLQLYSQLSIYLSNYIISYIFLALALSIYLSLYLSIQFLLIHQISCFSSYLYCIMYPLSEIEIIFEIFFILFIYYNICNLSLKVPKLLMRTRQSIPRRIEQKEGAIGFPYTLM